jgi:hypothetical protein
MNAAQLRLMMDAGLTLEQVVAIAEAGDQAPTRSKGAERQARYRRRQAESVTSDATGDVTPPPETKVSPTPPSKTQTLPPSPPLGGSSPTISADQPGERENRAAFGPFEALATWNDLARRTGLPVAKSLTPQRRRAITARLAEHGEAGWRQALAAIERSAFLRGGNDRAFRADLDFVGQPKSFTRLIEGFYGNGAGHDTPGDSTAWGDDEWRAAVAIWGESGAWSDALGPPPDHPQTRVPPHLRPPDQQAA